MQSDRTEQEEVREQTEALEPEETEAEEPAEGLEERSDEKTEEDPAEGPEEGPEGSSEEKSEEDPAERPKEGSEAETEEEPAEESEEGSKEESEEEPVEESEEGSEETSEEESGEEPAESEAEEETESPDIIYDAPGQPRKRSRKHRKKNWALRLIIIAGAIAVFVVVANMQYFEIKETAVIGNKVVSDKKILKLSQIQEGDSIFFLNPLLTGSRIKENKYIETVKIKQHLPGTVEIYVTERERAAQFLLLKENGKKRYVVTDAKGMVLGIHKKKKHVTLVGNVTVTNAVKGSTVQVDNTGVYHRAMELIATAKEGDLYFKTIHIKGSLVEAYIYDDLKCEGRFKDIISSIKSGELKAVVYRLYQEDVEKGIIYVGENNYCSFTPK